MKRIFKFGKVLFGLGASLLFAASLTNVFAAPPRVAIGNPPLFAEIEGHPSNVYESSRIIIDDPNHVFVDILICNIGDFCPSSLLENPPSRFILENPIKCRTDFPGSYGGSLDQIRLSTCYNFYEKLYREISEHILARDNDATIESASDSTRRVSSNMENI